MPGAAGSPIEEQDLWHLVYASVAVPGFTLADLEDILRVARERNAQMDVGGVLLLADSSFLQVLEGGQAEIDGLLAAIRGDPRHSRPVLLLREPIAERAFADWTMGYTRVTLGELRDATGINDFFRDQESFSDLTDAKVRRVLDLFRAGSFRQRLG
jgi:hypothetical protein